MQLKSDTMSPLLQQTATGSTASVSITALICRDAKEQDYIGYWREVKHLNKHF
jgi:hypothetical protein